ncbi:MATE family efflux transporter [Prevotella pallens]|uniref:MATE family efflux transporter n=1 Tax=Prevotella pallens TaxID=60133 RepID=UPI0028E9A7CC|nr:MATE family efflux transporter [Prevotella pallens]
MPEISSKRQVTKNAIMLYVRMFVSMIIGLYSSRVVLSTLGVSDYGVYNVVGAIVPVFAFLSNAMASSISRFITFELGKGDFGRLKKTFSSAVLIQIVIGVVIFILAELIGGWFLREKLVIPPERMNAANWIFQLSVLSILLNIIQIPYYACIIAHEKMEIYAYIEILYAVFKLITVFLLIVIGFDKLILLGIISSISLIIITLFYVIYSIRSFGECRSKIIIDKNIIRPMITFSGYDTYGNICLAVKSQGIPFVVNLFLGVVINAAVGIVYTVTNMFRSFCGNILTVFRPQVVKFYAQNDFSKMTDTINLSIRMLLMLSILLVTIFIYNSQVILQLWLVKVPPLTSLLLNIALIENLFALLTDSLRIGVNATGRIKGYCFWSGTLIILVVPVSYFVLKWHYSPQSVFIISLLSQVLCTGVSLFYLKKEVPQYSIISFLKILSKVIFPLLVVVFVTFIIDFKNFGSLQRLFLSTMIILILYFSSVYITLEKKEKQYVIRYLRRKQRK